MERINFGEANPASLHAHNLLKTAREKRVPLTEKQYEFHLNYAYQKTESLESQGVTTESMYSKKLNGQNVWDKARALQHQEIIDAFLLKWQNIPTNREAVLSGGLAGGGKTSTLTHHTPYILDDYAFLSPDDMKEAMALRGMFPEVHGLTPMEVSALGYEESCYLTEILFEECLSKGRNLIYDTTMGSHAALSKKLLPLKEHEYSLNAVFVDIEISTSLRRSQERHRRGLNRFLRDRTGQGGRLLPRYAVKNQAPSEFSKFTSLNREIFNGYREDNWFDKALIFDNNTDGRAPMLVQG